MLLVPPSILTRPSFGALNFAALGKVVIGC